MKRIKVSVIIVHYGKDELSDCLTSINKCRKTIQIEVIVVDNDGTDSLSMQLKHKFGWVHYVKSPGNLGFGGGNNIGAKQAKGSYLFFLNPDTIVFRHSISGLAAFLDENPDAAIVAPLLLDRRKAPYKLQGTMELSPLTGFFSLSVINRIFPANPVSSYYWLMNWDKRGIRKVAVVPGSAFMIRKEVFADINGFDENFFLYFEEHDLCKRVSDKGWNVYMVPDAEVIHKWGMSTETSKQNIKKIFSESKWRYFKKHFGYIPAVLITIFSGIGIRSFLKQ